jgi:hypothetical protein
VQLTKWVLCFQTPTRIAPSSQVARTKQLDIDIRCYYSRIVEVYSHIQYTGRQVHNTSRGNMCLIKCYCHLHNTCQLEDKPGTREGLRLRRAWRMPRRKRLDTPLNHLNVGSEVVIKITDDQSKTLDLLTERQAEAILQMIVSVRPLADRSSTILSAWQFVW